MISLAEHQNEYCTKVKKNVHKQLLCITLMKIKEEVLKQSQ